MPCPTCDHTLQQIPADLGRLYWCPRCGTLHECGVGGFVRSTPPALVKRLRKYVVAAEEVEQSHEDMKLWHRAGIVECISPTGTWSSDDAE